MNNNKKACEHNARVSMPCLGASITVGLLVVLGAQSAVAQALPPGSDPSIINEELRRRQERVLQTPAPKETDADDLTSVQPLVIDPIDGGGVSFLLTGVTFDDSAFLNPSDLVAIAAEYIDQIVTFDDLNALVARVNELYDRGGYVTARAILAPQKVEDGRVHISLVEGRVGSVNVTGATYYPERFVEQRIDLTSGDIVDVPDLEEQILFFNRISDANLSADLKPGGVFGTTDIDLILLEPKRTQFDVFFDNNGFDSTGEYEGGLVARHKGLLKADDRVGVFFVGAEGSLSGSFSYNAPIDSRGWQAGLSYVRGRTKVVNGPFSDLNVIGNSSTTAINTSHPIIYNGGFLVNGVLSAQRTVANTTVDGVGISDTRIYQAELGFSTDYIGAKQITVMQVSGLVADASERLFNDNRAITLLRGSTFYARNLSSKMRASIDAQWQYAFDDDLPGTLEFQLGGANSLRAFDPGTSAGDSGYFVKVELARNVWSNGRNQLEFFTFFDRGQAYSLFPTQTLSSVGLGANLSRIGRAKLSTSVAIPVEEKGIVEQSDVKFFVSLNITAF